MVQDKDRITENYFGKTTSIPIYNIFFDDPKDEKNYYFITFMSVLDSIDFSMNEINMDSLWDDSYDQKMTLGYGLSIVGLKDSFDSNFDRNGKCLFFSDEDFNGETKKIKLELLNNLYYDKTLYGYVIVELFHVNESYYKYYVTQKKQHNGREDIFVEPTQIYSNIEGGIGVFAGASVSMQCLKIAPNP